MIPNPECLCGQVERIGDKEITAQMQVNSETSGNIYENVFLALGDMKGGQQIILTSVQKTKCS
jgi:hypothetical protein